MCFTCDSFILGNNDKVWICFMCIPVSYTYLSVCV